MSTKKLFGSDDPKVSRFDGVPDLFNPPLKPEQVEQLHWQGDFLPASVIVPTAWNALESAEGELTADYVCELLREEFSERMILASRARVEKVVGSVLGRLRFRREVAAAYAETCLDWQENGKREVMRALSGRFERGRMRDVYTALVELGIAGGVP